MLAGEGNGQEQEVVDVGGVVTIQRSVSRAVRDVSDPLLFWLTNPDLYQS